MNAINEFLQKKQRDDKPLKYWIDLLEEMLNTPRFSWAENTLSGIYYFVTTEGTISEKQIMAINNIWQSQNNSYGYRRKKRNQRCRN